MTRQGSLAALFDPASVAVVGASADPAKWGHILSRRALESGADRPVALVNRGALIAPFHNMMLVSPATTRRQVDRLVAAFGDVAASLAA